MEASEIFVARQPIFDQQFEVIGYELLYRDSVQNEYPEDVNGEKASAAVLGRSFFIDEAGKLTQGKKAFVNFTAPMLIAEYPLLCDKDQLVIEILEDAVPSRELSAACRQFLDKGYTLALDDFVYAPEKKPLLELAKIIKLDFMQLTRAELQRHAMIVSLRSKAELLAEKVENYEDVSFAKEIGCKYFQGFFFCKPQMVTIQDIPSSKLHLLRILKLINNPGYDFKELAEIITQDVSMAYKLLRYVNSSWFGLATKVRSLQSAVALLGEINIRKWLSIIVLTAMAKDKPSELMRQSILRAFFCEYIAELVPQDIAVGDACYTIGMFSLLDSMLDRPMAEILSELALDEVIRRAILESQIDEYRFPLELLLAYENGRWEEVAELTGKFGVSQGSLPGIYRKALDTVEQFEHLD